MQNFVSFFKSGRFFIHLLIILLVIAGIFFGTIKYLNAYTAHGQFVQVPDFSGLTLQKLDDFIKDKNVSYQVIDSLYDPDEKPGLVLRQDPEPGSKVKHNRTVYLYVTGMVPPRIQMPRLIDRSERQARLILETYGLRTGRISDIKADCNGCVLAQQWKGRDIEPGAPVKKGSVIDLVVGRNDAYFAQHPDTSNLSPD